MEWSLAHQDPRAPMFQRQNDLVLQWGGPNADNIYRHARVHPSHTYRIVGRMHSCEDFILAIRRNFMHMEINGTIAELSAHELGLQPGDDFEILLGGEGDEPNRVPLPDGALSVSIREYYFDWQPREPATFTIECLDADGPAAVHLGEPRVRARRGRHAPAVARSPTGTSTCSTRAPSRPTTCSVAATT